MSTKAKPWPRLSEDLPGPRRPDQCQGCGGICDLDRWREHDQADRPEPIVVVLCLECSDKLIEPHKRLYAEIHRNQPWPGCMDLCISCKRRDGVRCTHPDLKANGGTGLAITGPEPSTTFIDYTDKQGRRRGHAYLRYPHEPTECAGREGDDVIRPVWFQGTEGGES